MAGPIRRRRGHRALTVEHYNQWMIGRGAFPTSIHRRIAHRYLTLDTPRVNMANIRRPEVDQVMRAIRDGTREGVRYLQDADPLISLLAYVQVWAHNAGPQHTGPQHLQVAVENLVDWQQAVQDHAGQPDRWERNNGVAGAASVGAVGLGSLFRRLDRFDVKPKIERGMTAVVVDDVKPKVEQVAPVAGGSMVKREGEVNEGAGQSSNMTSARSYLGGRIESAVGHDSSSTNEKSNENNNRSQAASGNDRGTISTSGNIVHDSHRTATTSNRDNNSDVDVAGSSPNSTPGSASDPIELGASSCPIDVSDDEDD